MFTSARCTALLTLLRVSPAGPGRGAAVHYLVMAEPLYGGLCSLDGRRPAGQQNAWHSWKTIVKKHILMCYILILKSHAKVSFHHAHDSRSVLIHHVLLLYYVSQKQLKTKSISIPSAIICVAPALWPDCCQPYVSASALQEQNHPNAEDQISPEDRVWLSGVWGEAPEGVQAGDGPASPGKDGPRRGTAAHPRWYQCGR